MKKLAQTLTTTPVTRLLLGLLLVCLRSPSLGAMELLEALERAGLVEPPVCATTLSRESQTNHRPDLSKIKVISPVGRIYLMPDDEALLLSRLSSKNLIVLSLGESLGVMLPPKKGTTQMRIFWLSLDPETKGIAYLTSVRAAAPAEERTYFKQKAQVEGIQDLKLSPKSEELQGYDIVILAWVQLKIVEKHGSEIALLLQQLEQLRSLPEKDQDLPIEFTLDGKQYRYVLVKSENRLMVITFYELLYH